MSWFRRRVQGPHSSSCESPCVQSSTSTAPISHQKRLLQNAINFQTKRGKINKRVLYCLVHNSLVAGSKIVRSVKGLARSCRGGNQVAAPVSALTPPSGSASAVDGKASYTRNAPFLFADVQLTFQSGRFPHVLQSSHSPSFLSGVITKLTKAHLWILRVRIGRGHHRRSAYSQRGHRAAA
jgi:hypothetical protein